MTDDQLFGEVDLEERISELEEEVKSLNAFLVHKGFAEEYIRWKGDDWWVNVFIAIIVSEMTIMGNVVFAKIPTIIQEVGI